MALDVPTKDPYSVRPKRRMDFLKMNCASGRSYPNMDLFARRERFSQYKQLFLPPINTVRCYITGCQNCPEEYHHVVHLSRGGRDTKRNIVPLCKSHHKQVHRHNKVRGNRQAYKTPQLGVIHTTKFIPGVVVITPKVAYL